MIGAIRAVSQMLAFPLGIAILVAGFYGLSYWWVVALAAITAVGFADQTLGEEDPYPFNTIIPGPRYKDLIAGCFGFAGTLAGFSVMYLIGRVFG